LFEKTINSVVDRGEVVFLYAFRRRSWVFQLCAKEAKRDCVPCDWWQK